MSLAKVRTWFAMGLAVAGLGFAAPALAQQATISGRVLDQNSGRPIPDAVVTVVGTNIQATTDAEGRYTLRNVLPGRVQIRAARIGYQAQVQVLNVPSGAQLTVDFDIPAAVVSLDEVVVTATGEQRQRELGNVVGKIQAAQVVEEAPITNLSDLLTARTPGVVVQRSSGQVGSGTRIRIRGANSLSLSNEPLVYVDGIRVEQGVSSVSVFTGGQAPSRLDDLNPEDIESIEIIKGPSAATLYGTEAANGVIRITTKRGRPGRSRWNVYVEGGVLTDPNEYPTNYRAFGRLLPSNAFTNNCTLVRVGNGQCVQDSILKYNPLEDPEESPISTGYRSQYGANISGGTDLLSYYLSGEYEKEVGTYRLPKRVEDSLKAVRGELPPSQIRPNSLERVSLRSNLRTQALSTAELSAQAGFTTSNLQIVQNDNNSLGILPSAFFGTWSRNVNRGWGFRLPEEVFAINTRQKVDRFTGSLNANWQPISWLTVRGIAGLDLTSRLDDQFFPTGEVPASTTLLAGDKTANRAQIYQYTADFGVTANHRLSSFLQVRSSVGVQYFRDLFTFNGATGNGLPAGAKSVGAAATTRATESTAERITLGAFVEEQLNFNERLFLTLGVRRDDASSFGRDLEAIVYPKFSASWVITEEPFFPEIGFLASLRVRGAWGETGLQPGTTDAVAFFNPVGVSDATGADVVGVTVGGIGNTRLKPERAREIEAGGDVDLFDGRVGVQVTYFKKTSRDALVSRVLAPSLGSAAARFENLGSVENRGWEGVFSARLLDTRLLQWEVTLTGSTLENKLLELGEGIDPISFGIQRHVEGYPLGGFWQRPIKAVNDANQDGVIAIGEITVGDTAEFLGAPLPKRELTISSAVTLFDRVRIQGLMDHKGGHVRDAGTMWFRCSQIQTCESAYVPGADLYDQAAAVMALAQITRAGYVRDASFWKLREVSLTFFWPDNLARLLGVSRASLTLTGRNLLTITDWPDLDPEASLNQGNFTAQEFLTQPPIRYWIARLNLNF
ncbi:TonB-dependent receptor SusC [bacterium HR33]|nr:TonB-dependent receptor SusC [bacterium HR33]